MNKRELNLETAIELMRDEHGDCDDPTCSIAHALDKGADLLALDIYLGSGAASEAICELELPRNFTKRSFAEIDLLGPTAVCPHCNANTWDLENYMDKHGNVHCGSCAKDFFIESAQNFEEGE